MTVKMEVMGIFDPVAFVAALVSAPVLVALLGFWALFIPIGAAIFGGPIYLVFGTPVLLWMVTRFPPEAGIFACAGLLVQSALTIGLAIAARLLPLSQAADLLPAALFGMVFAPIWGAVFIKLYRRWYRPARFFPVM